ncbi:MAG: HAD family phosphatase [Ginsengibacter sp.]
MQKIENIIFDLGNVILDVDYNLTKTAFEKLGINNFDEMFSQTSADNLFQNLETGAISEQQFYSELNQCTNLRLSESEIKNAWNAMLLNFREESLDFLLKLQKRFKLYLFSNTNFIHMDEFDKIYNSIKRDCSFNDYFTTAYYSCDIGQRKPEIASYQYIIKHANIDAGKTVFVDDTLQNVEAATIAGLKAIQLKPHQRIENLQF